MKRGKSSLSHTKSNSIKNNSAIERSFFIFWTKPLDPSPPRRRIGIKVFLPRQGGEKALRSLALLGIKVFLPRQGGEKALYIFSGAVTPIKPSVLARVI